MRPRTIAAAWIAGATVPVLCATVFILGCCILPFHGALHELMPLCNLAASVMRGDSHDHNDHGHDALPPPPREKQEPVKRIVTDVPEAFRLTGLTTVLPLVTPAAATAYRSFISLGAIRCDCDVGLYVLVETFRI